MKLSKMSGKLEGFLALNTSSLDNPFCKNKLGGEVCNFCYSDRMLSTYRKCANAGYVQNGVQLSERIIPLELIPEFPLGAYVRINSFGEILNQNHADNILEIARINHTNHFGLWTKRPGFFSGKKIPRNLIMNFSVGKLGDLDAPVPEGFDRNFVVFHKGTTEEELKELETEERWICRKNCRHCLVCYDSRESTGIKTIMEVLK